MSRINAAPYYSQPRAFCASPAGFALSTADLWHAVKPILVVGLIERQESESVTVRKQQSRARLIESDLGKQRAPLRGLSVLRVDQTSCLIKDLAAAALMAVGRVGSGVVIAADRDRGGTISQINAPEVPEITLDWGFPEYLGGLDFENHRVHSRNDGRMIAVRR